MKIDFAATAFEGAEWIDLAQDKDKREVFINKELAIELH